jgi:hypothetical protein
MATATLVERQIIEGASLLDALDQRGLIVDACAWSFGSESGTWFLNVATPLADSFGLEATILSILRTVRELKLASVSFLNLNVSRDSDEFSRTMRAIIRRDSLAGNWYPAVAVGGSDLGNLYVYRCFSKVTQYRGFYLGVELMPRRDATYSAQIRVYPPVRLQRKPGGAPLVADGSLPAFTRTLGISDEVAAQHRLLDRAGSQPRVWAFLSERGLGYVRRIIDLMLDRRATSVIPRRELLLTSDMTEFPFTAQDDAALLEAEFAAPSRV